jgi:hypothetical protein
VCLTSFVCLLAHFLFANKLPLDTMRSSSSDPYATVSSRQTVWQEEGGNPGFYSAFAGQFPGSRLR